jgi:hypothetical protein
MRILNVADGVTGGTGKSPMVRWIAECDLARNVLPLIALRGYRSHQSQSDEAMEHQSALPDAKIALGANRFATISAAVAQDPSVGIVSVSTRSYETESATGVAPSSANRVASVEDISSVSETDLPECLSTNGEFKSGEHRLWMSLLSLLIPFVVGFDVISNVQIRCYDVPLW